MRKSWIDVKNFHFLRERLKERQRGNERGKKRKIKKEDEKMNESIKKAVAQPKCPTTDEWIKKMWHLYIMELYSAIKKNEMLSFAGKWMELENVILREVSQVQKARGHMFSLIYGIQTQIQQNYEKQVTLGEVTSRRGSKRRKLRK
jgi:hypothetical protein